jgi:hypothetical protein
LQRKKNLNLVERKRSASPALIVLISQDVTAFLFLPFARSYCCDIRSSPWAKQYIQGIRNARDSLDGVGIGAIVQIVHRILEGGAPSSALMGGVAVLALSVNGFCAYRLIRFRGGDASMRAIWLSTRNDAMLNVLTVVAAGVYCDYGIGLAGHHRRCDHRNRKSGGLD